MAARDLKKRLDEAAEQLNRHERRQDGEAVVASLSEGLTILRNSLYLRVHHDVEKIVGKDSMLMPLSEGELNLHILPANLSWIFTVGQWKTKYSVHPFAYFVINHAMTNRLS